ncbi:hypothetical protein NP493_403g05028 [Ridgeia piscesae]|uniref:EGF-like domain-containing protein n=1 Tax=Ridgeia piscesae TaxID=27915 RepID=A0AAD9L0Z4_RIDPI|nr:hypothetical protein NP493_403g05028 [Ridgeia piscesae]
MKPEVTSMIVSLFVVTLVLHLVTSDVNADDSFFGDVAKRGSRFVRVPFSCNGYDATPRCLHGGRGPRKTWTRSGRMCVCLCPSGAWTGPECGTAVTDNDIYVN